MTPDLPRPARIAHVTECLASGTLSFLVLATRELARSGARQALLFSRRPDTPHDVEKLFDPSVELIELPALSEGLWRYTKALRAALLRELAAEPCRAVHFHSSKAGFIGRMLLRSVGSLPPVYYSPHGLSFLDRRSRLRSHAFRTLEKLAARSVTSTSVGCSRGEALLLEAVGGADVKVIENAIDDTFFHIRPQPSEPPVIISMGRLCYQKAPARFAAMAVRFQVAQVPARFVWIGNGDDKEEARLRAAGVEVTGWVDRPEVARRLAEACVYVQTSRWEGMPLAVLQALAAGLPCVVTDVVGNRDAVRQGITGFVADDGDSLLMGVMRLLEDPALRVRMSLAARSDAMERFGHDAFRSRLCELYGLDAMQRQDSGSTLLPFGRPGPAIGMPSAREPAQGVRAQA